MDMIRCDIKLLEEDHMHVSAELKVIKEQLDIIKNYLYEINSIWTGDAATAFVRNYSMIVNKMGMLLLMLQQVEKLEIASRDSYKEGEKEISEIIGLINIPC